MCYLDINWSWNGWNSDNQSSVPMSGIGLTACVCSATNVLYAELGARVRMKHNHNYVKHAPVFVVLRFKVLHVVECRPEMAVIKALASLSTRKSVLLVHQQVQMSSSFVVVGPAH